MRTDLVQCPFCKRKIPPSFYNLELGETFLCPRCKRTLAIYAYPALYKKKEIRVEAKAASLDDATCYYHPKKKAEEVCDNCGRFLCGLCVLPLGEQNLCSACLEIQRSKSDGSFELQPSQIRKDKLAVALVILPLLFWPFTLFTAPAALVVVIRNWNKKFFFAQNSRLSFSFAFIFALLQCIGWLIFFFTLFDKNVF